MRIIEKIVAVAFSLVAMVTTGMVAQSAFTAEEAYAAQIITVDVEGVTTQLPSLTVDGINVKVGAPIKTSPGEIEVPANSGKHPIATLADQKAKQGQQLYWVTNKGTRFDWNTTPLTADITELHGKWETMKCTVTVSEGWDSGVADKKTTVEYGKTMAAPKTPTRTGYQFAGWKDMSTGKMVDWSSPIKVTSSTTIRAQWTLVDTAAAPISDPTADIPKECSGSAFIGATWDLHPAHFSISLLSGYLEGISGTGTCATPSAAAGSNMNATYHATLKSINIETGEVVYDVTIVPPDAAYNGGPRNQYGLIGYQQVSYEAVVHKNFGGWIEINKSSTKDFDIDGNPNYSVQGAKYGIYADEACTQLKGTLTTGANGYAKSDLLPQATYYVKELSASSGHARTKEMTTTSVTSGQTTTLDVNEEPEYDTPDLSKISADIVANASDTSIDYHKAQGNASMKNAVFKIVYSSDLNGSLDADVVRTWYATTDEKGAFTLNSIKEGKITVKYTINGTEYSFDFTSDAPFTRGQQNVMPVGSLTVTEILPPEGYLLDNNKEIKNYSQVGKVTGTVRQWKVQGDPLAYDPYLKKIGSQIIKEQVVRGDISLKKNAADTQGSLAGVPFVIESKTTGEKHLAVTDQNGVIKTANDINQHSNLTNGNDQYLATNGDGSYIITDESKLDPNCGIWFTGYAANSAEDKATPVKDSVGALPYDTYILTEVMCSANKGYSPIVKEVTVSRNGQQVPDDTILDSKIVIHTTATDDTTSGHIGLIGDEKTTLNDIVSYKGLIKGQDYEVTGTLMDKETGKALTDENGKTFTSTVKFTAEESEGDVTVPFEVPSSVLAGKTTVVFEKLYWNGTEVASHEELKDDGQTVYYPSIHTNATDKTTGTHEGTTVDEKTTIVDKVTYEGLKPGLEYKLSGVLMDKETGKELLGENGETFTLDKTFTPEESSGEIELEFEVPSNALKGKTTVVFENLFQDNVKVGAHADINDNDQTVYYPNIHTNATDGITEDHEGLAEGEITLNDEVSYENLARGAKYTLTGVLMDKATGEPLLDASGNKITASTEFIAGKDYTKNNDKTDESTADNENANTNANENGNTNITDNTNKNTNANVNDNKNTNEADNTNSGDESADDETNTDETDRVSGKITVSFVFDASIVQGKQTVVFEDLYRGIDLTTEANIARHADINDEGQEVDYPDLHTTATVNGEHTAQAINDIELTDTVSYTNLEPGKTYRVEGVLMNKTTGETVKTAGGADVTASTEFSPESENGEVQVVFHFDASALANTDTVVFENLYKVGAGVNGTNTHVGKHEDLDDADQTVHFNEADLADILQTGDALPYAIAGTTVAAAVAIFATRSIRAKRRMK